MAIQHVISWMAVSALAAAIGGCSFAVDLDGLNDGPLQATTDGGTAVDATSDAIATSDAGAGDSIDAGLLAFYPFDVTAGTTAVDESGNGRDGTLVDGATFAAGIENEAVAMNGNGQYVNLPPVLSGATAFSISAWVYLNRAATWSRIFDFGTGTSAYMMLTAASDVRTLRFAITVGGETAEQRLETAELPTGSWQHVTVTFAGRSGTLYVNGTAVDTNGRFSLNPASLGSITHNWLGRSQFTVDPTLNGYIDDVRIYGRALSAAEVQALAVRP